MDQLKYNKVVQGDDDHKGPVHECGLAPSFSSFEFDSGNSSVSSFDSDSFEEVTSPVSSSSSSSSSCHQLATEPLNDMSTLFQQLPIKRGLSQYYEGKSQSFTSLAKVRSLEDLVKPENPYNKKFKCSQRDSCSSLSANRGSDNIIGRRTPIPPHRSTTTTSIPNQTALFV